MTGTLNPGKSLKGEVTTNRSFIGHTIGVVNKGEEIVTSNQNH